MQLRPFFGAILLLCCLPGASAGPAQDAPRSSGDRPVDVELTDRDLAAIKTIMVQNALLLASSPGIKHATAYLDQDEMHANVIFFPHEVIGGIGRAVNARCMRTLPDGVWTCPSGSLRLYVQVPGQEFQMRVIGNIDYEVALALVDATRETLRAHPEFVEAAPDTAIMIFSNTENIVTVGWGDDRGHLAVNVAARLIAGQDPRRAGNWRVIRVADEPWDDPRHAANISAAGANRSE